MGGVCVKVTIPRTLLRVLESYAINASFSEPYALGVSSSVKWK